MTHINCMLSNPWTLIALWLVMFLQAVCCDASQNMLTLPHSPWCPLTLDWIGNGGTFCMVVMRWRGVRRHNAADLSYKPSDRVPLLSARHTVTNYTAWRQRQACEQLAHSCKLNVERWGVKTATSYTSPCYYIIPLYQYSRMQKYQKMRSVNGQ